ncbi:hypothetical protein NLI96_g7992 [Meripilus lineatus]|uniref:Uncharacterized protein n=1 Tax=Meripilus lineatus TaxID=2056292 RepID=A0AAD5YGP8_9APHY|nr:hypothetical protein NLI96_g7992 [Physisporinus lineatus]
MEQRTVTHPINGSPRERKSGSGLMRRFVKSIDDPLEELCEYLSSESFRALSTREILKFVLESIAEPRVSPNNPSPGAHFRKP